MRIAIFSDIHGNLPALEAVLSDIASLHVDAVYCLGDLVGYAPFPTR
jgi:predicted phosphodiesterase